jgi:ankyrin repeat protein
MIIFLKHKAAANDGNAPLHWAARNSDWDVVKYLVGEKGADVLARNNHDAVLHRAVSGNNKQIIRLFLDKIIEKFNQDSISIVSDSYQISDCTNIFNAQHTEGDTQAYHLLPEPKLDKKNIRVPPLIFSKNIFFEF